MKNTFSDVELAALRKDLIHGVLTDSREAAEMLQVFLTCRGYGTSPEATLDAVAHIEKSGCSMAVLQSELEGLALVM